MNSLHLFVEFLERESISYETDNTTTYMSDASFLTLGKPGLVVFPTTEEETCAVVGFASANQIPLTPRAKGSSTAGASIAPEGGVMMLTDRLGVVNRFGKRLGRRDIGFHTREGDAIAPGDLTQHESDEVYARVGAGLTTDELDRYLAEYGWHTAVIPSSGWSTIGGNFSTNAGGNGTPKYGTFRSVVNRLRLVTSEQSDNAAKIATVTDRATIEDMGGGQGLYGIILELDVRIVPNLRPEELYCAICHSTAADIESLGNTIGKFMSAMQQVCHPEIAEFMMLDKGIFADDDPLLSDPEVGGLLNYPEGQFRMITMYLGKQNEMQELEAIAGEHDNIEFTTIDEVPFRKMLAVRKLATGKSPGRVALPGFEDIYVKDPQYLGKVLAGIFEITSGSLPGRPIGHQYTGGVVVHYRPQARPVREDYDQAWVLMRELAEEICQDDYQTIKRQEHGLGLEVYSLASESQRQRMLELKQTYDPASIFQSHIITDAPQINFAGDQFRSMKAE